MSDIYARYDEVERLIDAEKFREAVDALLPLVEQDETFALGHLALARVFTKLNQHEDAINHGVKAFELEPEDSINFTALSITYQRAWAGTQNPEYITRAEDAMAIAQRLGSR